VVDEVKSRRHTRLCGGILNAGDTFKVTALPAWALEPLRWMSPLRPTGWLKRVETRDFIAFDF